MGACSESEVATMGAHSESEIETVVATMGAHSESEIETVLP